MTALSVPTAGALIRDAARKRILIVGCAAATVAVGIGAAVSWTPVVALLGAAAVALGALIVARPEVAAYLLVGVTPLVVGIDRDRVLPVLRPNEALLVLCAAALSARWLWGLRTGERARPRPSPIVAALVVMAAANSVVLLLVMSFRGDPITGDDLAYAAVLWKYLALYAVVRAAVRSEPQILRCLQLSLAAASIVAVIAILQSLQLFGVPRLLSTLFTEIETSTEDPTRLANNRGSSTLALPAATGDLMIFNLALCAGLWRRHRISIWMLAPLASLLLIGALASGQFSTAIGLVVAMIAIGLLYRRADVPFAFGLVGLAAMWPLLPVVAKRLSGFDRVSGLPESWEGRLYNLQNYFWPRLFSDGNYLFGVQVSARVPGPDSRLLPWVWIESGYTWLLWSGGVPLFLAYVLFVVSAVRRSWHVARVPDATGVAATGVFVGVLVVVVLMLFDPHFTYRGAADLMLCLIALMTAGWSFAQRKPTTSPPRPRADEGAAP